MNDILITLLSGTIRLTTPIAFAALGALVMELSGINGLATEGLMLVGSFGAVLGSYYTGNAWIGVLVGVISAVLVGLVRSYLSIRHNANQTVSGIGLNMFAVGFTAVLLKAIWNVDGRTSSVQKLGEWSFPIIKDLPIIGSIFGKHISLVYLLIPTAILVWYMLEKTNLGLRIKVAGEKPEVLASLGLSAAKYRYIATILGSAIIGLGGAYLSVGQLSFFSLDMSGGRGFMALASVVFGGWGVVGTVVGAFLFGFADALQMSLQSSIKYTQFIQMLPYILTIVVLAGVMKKGGNSGPSAAGKSLDDQI